MTAIVVIGNGPAAHRLVTRLHQHGHRGPVTVLGVERSPAYNRALLALVLDGTLSAAHLALPPLDEGVRALTGTRVSTLDLPGHRIRTDAGEELRYDVLVFATGSRPRRPVLAGAGRPSAPGIRTLYTLDDARPVGAGPVVVVGGGLRGVETAHALGRAGHEVTLVHGGPTLMHRLLDDRAGGLLAAALGASGVPTRPGRRVVAVEPGHAVLDDGELLPAATLVLCTGSTPETALARTVGLTVRQGIVVDERLRTSQPDVYAVGDCVEHPAGHGTLDSAWDQAEALARVLTGGSGFWRPVRQTVRPRLPGLDVLVAGPPGALGTPGDDEQVVLSDPARGRYGRLVLREDRVHAAVLFGLSRAAASVGRLYTADRPLPADRLALLLGSDGEYAHSGELPDSAVVCHCNNVAKKVLVQAWQQGARDVPALAAATRATTGCGSCTALVRQICATAAAS